MAGEWLKLELSTPDKPELLKLSRITQLHKDAVLGKLIRIWAWFDRNSVDGHVDGVVAADIDELALHDGFSIALKQVNWMDFSDAEQWVKLMNFDRHNGETAKTRALKTKRQEKWRANKDANVDYETSTQPSTTASTREEKRREDIKRGLPEDFSISDGIKIWAQKNGYSQLDKHFDNFIDSCLAKGYKYKDWDAAFRNAIKNNWANVEPKKPNGLVF